VRIILSVLANLVASACVFFIIGERTGSFNLPGFAIGFLVFVLCVLLLTLPFTSGDYHRFYPRDKNKH